MSKRNENQRLLLSKNSDKKLRQINFRLEWFLYDAWTFFIRQKIIKVLFVLIGLTKHLLDNLKKRDEASSE